MFLFISQIIGASFRAIVHEGAARVKYKAQKSRANNLVVLVQIC